MATRKPWDRPEGSRAGASRSRRRVLIICEDKKSSSDYFRAFSIDRERAEVKTVGTGMNTVSLVDEAIRLKEAAERLGQPFSHVWCVFDRDSFPPQHFEEAIRRAQESRMELAWSNEAFELWYLLHFNYHDTAIPRHQYKNKLRPHLRYSKSDPGLYERLKQNQGAALKNARRLERFWAESSVRLADRNPSTRVHKLVEFLNELAELGEAS